MLEIHFKEYLESIFTRRDEWICSEETNASIVFLKLETIYHEH